MTKSTNTQDKHIPNPTGKGGFGDNPQNRGRGFWKKESTPRFKLEKMMSLSIKDLEVIVRDEDAPLFERKLAKAIVEDDWKTYREMMHEVYGTPKQTIEQTVIEKPIPLEDLSNGIRENDSVPQDQKTQ